MNNPITEIRQSFLSKSGRSTNEICLPVLFYERTITQREITKQKCQHEVRGSMLAG
jgi:hypothetical protein